MTLFAFPTTRFNINHTLSYEDILLISAILFNYRLCIWVNIRSKSSLLS